MSIEKLTDVVCALSKGSGGVQIQRKSDHFQILVQGIGSTDLWFEEETLEEAIEQAMTDLQPRAQLMLNSLRFQVLLLEDAYPEPK